MNRKSSTGAQKEKMSSTNVHFNREEKTLGKRKVTPYTKTFHL